MEYTHTRGTHTQGVHTHTHKEYTQGKQAAGSAFQNEDSHGAGNEINLHMSVEPAEEKPRGGVHWQGLP